MTNVQQWVNDIQFNGEKVVSYPDELVWIGQGRSAVVFKIPNENQVIKVFYPAYKSLSYLEAEIYNQLSNHEYFPALIDYGEGYLILELVEGITLYDCLVKGIPITVDMIEKVDAVLDFARNKGLNPSDTHLKNIMLTKDGQIKVIDVVRFKQDKESPHWDDLKRAFYSYYQKKYFPVKYPKFFIELIIRLYRRHLLPIR